MDSLDNLFQQLKRLLLNIGGLFLWIAPLALFLMATYLPKLYWDVSFDTYLNFLKILVWPYTVLVILFFFRKVITFLFLSINEFNFFGAKGNLRNANEIVLEMVNKKFLEIQNEEKRKADMETLAAEIQTKEEEINKAKGRADEILKVAKDTIKNWKDSTRVNNEIIQNLQTENRHLSDLISGLSMPTLTVNSVDRLDEGRTSDPISEEDNN